MRNLITAVVVSLTVLWNASWAFAQIGMPTPKWDEGKMLRECDVAVEGQVTTVKLLKRWIGDRQGVDTGYEYGDFECSFLVQKELKGKFKEGQTVEYVVKAYMEGKWDNPPPMGFVYEGTQAAVTQGTELRLYLKWNPEEKVYERVHFNSGFTVISASSELFPKKEGETVYAKDIRPPTNKFIGGENKLPLSEQEIRTLIDRLVSPYPKPQGGLPPDFDQDKQKSVREAVYETCTKLNALGEKAFPYLIERWEDKQYCLTVSHAPFPGCYHNLTVGEVCQRLIYGQVQPFGCRQVYGPSLSTSAIYQPPPAPTFRPVYPIVFLPSKEKARQWWDKNKGKRLQEIQLEVLDWVIAEEAKQPKEVSDMECQELQKIRQKLVTGGKPLASGIFYYYWDGWDR